MTPKPVADADRETFQQLIAVRRAALDHYVTAQKLSAQRKELIKALMTAGYSQSDIAREMGVSRQAVRKMISVG
jgi:DNA-directed RNA polymerase specialized sigma24 family protein